MEVDSYQNKPGDIQWRRDDGDGIVVLQSLLNDRCEGNGEGDSDGDGGGRGGGIDENADGVNIYGNNTLQ